jgi:KaiC/GvpD/RAD55 family RecA-like ATPase
LASTGVPSLDGLLGKDGYPDRSAVLVVGPPGIGKEALGYWFVRSGLVEGDYCLYATHRPVADVLRDMKGVGVVTDRLPEWIASSGSQVRLDLRDSTAISFNIKEAAHRNKAGRVRIATDVLSPLLVLNPLESMYGYWSQLLSDLKQQDSVLFALAEDGMHAPNVLTTMEQLFDGVIEMRLYEEGLAITPLFRIKKMLGLPPLLGYFRFSVSSTGMEVVPRVR